MIPSFPSIYKCWICKTCNPPCFVVMKPYGAAEPTNCIYGDGPEGNVSAFEEVR